MELPTTTELLIGPTSGLILSLYFCFQFLKRFEKTTEHLVEAFKMELDLCNHRYDFILSELMKLKEG